MVPTVIQYSCCAVLYTLTSRWVHLFFNMLIQLIVGIPLEMVHGSFRIGLIYMSGVLAGLSTATALEQTNNVF